jgi:hypothetical protein
MLFNYFAGAIFTPQEVVTFCLVAFAVIGTLAGLTLFIGKKLLNRTRKEGNKKTLSLGKALLVGFGLVAASILLFFVLPTMIKDNNWARRQQSCAKDAGYKSPNDDNSGYATAESQGAYRKCLGL